MTTKQALKKYGTTSIKKIELFTGSFNCQNCRERIWFSDDHKLSDIPAMVPCPSCGVLTINKFR